MFRKTAHVLSHKSFNRAMGVAQLLELALHAQGPVFYLQYHVDWAQWLMPEISTFGASGSSRKIRNLKSFLTTWGKFKASLGCVRP